MKRFILSITPEKENLEFSLDCLKECNIEFFKNQAYSIQFLKSRGDGTDENLLEGMEGKRKLKFPRSLEYISGSCGQFFMKFYLIARSYCVLVVNIENLNIISLVTLEVRLKVVIFKAVCSSRSFGLCFLAIVFCRKIIKSIQVHYRKIDFYARIFLLS